MVNIPQPGDVFQGRYQLKERIGLGSFAVVYRAEQVGIGRTVAVKILLPEDEDHIQRTAYERFRREAQLLSTLTHANTLTMFDYGESDEGQPFLVTEFVPGQTLRSLIKQEGCLSPPRAYHIIRQVLLSLREAHACGIIHRDMKPGNIMVFDRAGQTDFAKVLDFGIAKFIDSIQGDQIVSDLTLQGEIVGTPRYMAPELLTNKGVFPATDLYATGLILYEMLTGFRAVNAKSPALAMAEQVVGRPAIHPLDPLVPHALRPVLGHATAKSLDKRIAVAQGLIDELDAIDWDSLAGWKRSPAEVRRRRQAGNSSSRGPYRRPSPAIASSPEVVAPLAAADAWAEMPEGTDALDLDVMLAEARSGQLDQVVDELFEGALLQPEPESALAQAIDGDRQGLSNLTSPTLQALMPHAPEPAADSGDAPSLNQDPLEGRSVPRRNSLTDFFRADAPPVGGFASTAGHNATPKFSWPLIGVMALLVCLLVAGVLFLTSARSSNKAASNVDGGSVAARSVIVRSEPVGANVFHGERKLGKTPIQVEVNAASPIRLTITHDGFKSTDVVLDGAATGTMTIELEAD